MKELLRKLGILEEDAIQGCLFLSLFILSILGACALMAGWVALVVYIVLPPSIDIAGLEALRFALSFVGVISIAVAYIMGLHKIFNG